jgi:hypothetical protein
VLTRDARHIRVTEPRRELSYLVKHALKVEGCATYELKNVGSGGLLFERLVTLASQLREFTFLIDSGQASVHWLFATLRDTFTAARFRQLTARFGSPCHAIPEASSR